MSLLAAMLFGGLAGFAFTVGRDPQVALIFGLFSLAMAGLLASVAL